VPVAFSNFGGQNFRESDRGERKANTLVEFVLEFDPMETNGVKSALHDVHNHQDSSCCSHENEESKEEAVGTACSHEGNEALVVEHFSQLGMSKR